MEIIATHNHADFDGTASLVALHRLKPWARPVAPNSPERNVRAYLALHFSADFFLPPRDVERLSPTLLHVVDTKNAARLDPHVRRLVEERRVETRVIDHHPRNPLRIPGEIVHDEAVGACTTILVEKLIEKGATFPPEEATLYLLGIYEETGKLTYSGTTARDAFVAAELLRRGARLFILRQFIDEKLDDEQQRLYEKAMVALETTVVRGVRVHVAAFESDEFRTGLDVAAKKIRDEEKVRSLFLIAGMGKNVYLVGRNNDPHVDLVGLLARFGGGGHPSAAAASIRDARCADVKARLLKALPEFVEPSPAASDLMGPARTLHEGTRVHEADEFFHRTGLSAACIVDGAGTLSGLLHRHDVDRALNHRLENSTVAPFVRRHPIFVAPEATLDDLHDLFMKTGAPCLPVIGEGRLLGVVSREEFLVRHLGIDDLEPPVPASAAPGQRGGRFDEQIERALGARTFALLRDVGRLAERAQVHVYLVGGVVRDILLGRSGKDIDLVVEPGATPAAAFFERVAESLGGKLLRHDRFLTGTVSLYDGTSIDLAAARSEFYRSPGALPDVEEGSILGDLGRRDFTINAMALSLCPAGFGTLHDPFGGRNDLAKRALRILPNALSFVEDPLRIFRAIRFETRLAFAIEPETLERMRHAIGLDLVARAEMSRIGEELRLLLSEDGAPESLARLEEFDLLRFLSPGLRLPQRARRCARYVANACEHLALCGLVAEPWLVHMALLLEPLPPEETRELLARMHLRRRDIAGLLGGLEAAPGAYALLNGGDLAGERRMEVFEALKTLDPTGLALTLVQGDSRRARDHLRIYLQELREMRIDLSGEDLISMNLAPGPAFKSIKERLLREKIVGNLPDRATELAFLKELIHRGET